MHGRKGRLEGPLFERWETVMAKTSKRRTWNNADIRMLKALAKKRKRAAVIARTLKRSEGATRQKAFSIGLSLETRGV
jgi:hypothetical protein